MDSHTNSGISPIHADRYIKVCPTCGQVIPNDAEAARIQAKLDADRAAARSEGVAAAQPQIAALTTQITTIRETMDAKIEEQVGHRALQIEAKFSGALTSKDQQIESLTKKIGVLMRAADQQPVQRIGDIGELDVYNGLKLAYAQDTFVRVPKFQAGADVTATAMHNGEPAGSGLLEIKNVSTWRADYVPKLLQDQLDGGNDIPVLVTAAFPPGLQPHPQVYKGILICPPGAVVDFWGIVRGMLIRLHLAKAAGRDTGGAWPKICDFFAGKGRDLLASQGRGGAQLKELDRKLLEDVTRHVKDSNKIHDAQAANLTEIITAIDDILGGDDETI